MLIDFLDRLIGNKDEIPNKLTIGIGKLIHKARMEAKMSQAELASEAYMRQAAISDSENGKRDITVSDLLFISYALNKPFIYFLPKSEAYNLENKDLSLLEQELLLQARRLEKDDLRKIIAQARALADMP